MQRLFVSGRLCLFGEHSDWAGMYKVINSIINPGYAVVCGVEQGIYARVEKHDKFIVESSLTTYGEQRLECEMDTTRLLNIAKKGGFFSYVAGVASYINDNYTVRGIRIVIDDMTLPVKSGLSSSAAICVLVARAFNVLYNLKMNIKDEMLVAFHGEQRTPSRCGRLDQACAYGVKPVFMEFNGTEVSSTPVTLGGTFYYVIADLMAKKDTIQILSDLNQCYPFAKTEMENRVQEALGIDNEKYVNQAVAFLKKGDAKSLGALMDKAQTNFDIKVAPVSHKELSAPVLHSVLNDTEVRKLIYGAKGVGSQGDGTVQLLAKDERARDMLVSYLRNIRKMDTFSLTLRPDQKVKKAIIPVAGFGTRLFPATKGIKKEFFPLVDADGIVKPAILILLEQLLEAGIEKICLVIGNDEKSIYEDFFSPLSYEHEMKLSATAKEIASKIEQLRKKISYVFQEERLGFGHAVYLTKNFACNEPILLLLGDMLYHSNTQENCCKQVINAFNKHRKTLVSIQPIPKEQVPHYGILSGQWEDKEERILKVNKIQEKPSIKEAEERLSVINQNEEKEYFSVFGQYVLTPEVYEQLGRNIREGKKSLGEFQLTDALDTINDIYGIYAFRPDGTAYDIGLPEKYREAVWNFGKT